MISKDIIAKDYAKGHSLTIVHAADLHLDSAILGVAASSEASNHNVSASLARASRDAFRNLIDLCIDERAQFLLLAGDIFDGEWRDFNTGVAFVRELSRLEGTRVLIVRGNHDAESQVQKSLRLPSFVHEFSSRSPEVQTFSEYNLAIVGQSYRERDTRSDLAAGYPIGQPNQVTIGMLHTALEGSEGHAHYAPTTLGTLRDKHYSYWALGHVHTRNIIRSQTLLAAFPGNLQGRHARELGAKGALVLRVENGEIDVQFRALDTLRFHHLELDVPEDGDLGELAELFDAAAKNIVANDPGPSHRIFRVTLRTDAQFNAPLERLRAELRVATLGRDWLVEKVIVTPGHRRATAPELAGLLPPLAIEMQAALREQLHKIALELPERLRPSADQYETLFAMAEARARSHWHEQQGKPTTTRRR
jgi:DNA repair protein SbcD/Mre11